MVKLVIKTLLFIVITLAILFNYRFFTIHEGKVLVANYDKKDTWSEIYELTSQVNQAEYYVKPGEISFTEGVEYDYIVVLYTNYNLYNIKATEFDIERVERLLINEQVDMVEIHPVALWFYGLLYVLVIMFPLMRKVE